MKRVVAFLTAAWTLSASAFLPPTAEHGGVTVRIVGFDESMDTKELHVVERDASKPFPIKIQIENKSPSPVKGLLNVWLNDDWDVLDLPHGEVSVASGETKTLTTTARAKEGRALAALYPVHVSYAVAGGEALHPIAIFKATLPTAEAKGSQPQPNVGRVAPVATAQPLTEPEQFSLSVRGEKFTAEVSPGRSGLFDGTIAFSDGREKIVFKGFDCDVDGLTVSSNAQTAVAARCTARRIGDGYEIVHEVPVGGRIVPLRAWLWAEAGALRLRWDMPGVKRDMRGTPRYTRLAIGAGSLPAWRAYAGFGNVIENPRNFTLDGDGIRLSTRHVGVDYTNGLSFVQAVDVFPDRLVCRRDANVFSLETHHDATFSLIPSAKGAFAAARAFRDICGYRKSPAWQEAATRMCIDIWGGDFVKVADALSLAGKYGLGESIFVQHVWQRWGYDYRLPDVCPPIASEDFMKMRNAAKDAGMLFCPHDNYIDFYPDADGFSYDLVAFDSEGMPKKAWYNAGCRAQSYRWASHAFLLWLGRNTAAMRDSFAPDAIFIDVFSAMAPMDYYDRAGRFYPKMRTQAEWGRAFDTYREQLGVPKAVAVSEGGTDALVGHLDAGESDHFAARRWMDETEFDDSERTPWHDMATHGFFVLYAGGQSDRYCAISWNKHGDESLHGYGSDDYLNNTIIGGRTPMCGVNSRITVMTYWLLHDICKSLALANFESLDFDGTIHRQHSTFSNGGEVWSNRATNGAPWKVKGFTLPTYGFYAATPDAKAGIVEIDGRRCAFAKSSGRLFVDARAGGLVPFGSVKTDGAFRLEYPASGDWRIVPLPGSGPFRAEIDLARLGAERATVMAIEAVDAKNGASSVEWEQRDGILNVAVDSNAFAYRIRFSY